MKNLQQAKYEDVNGVEFPAELVDTLASYIHLGDSFYNWTCGGCGGEHDDRWPNISGRVIQCPTCKKMNLLVRTNCTEITDLVRRDFDAEYDKKELERLRGIEKYNQDELSKIKREIVSVAIAAINK